MCIAIGRGTCGGALRDRAARAGLVDHDDLLPADPAQTVRDDADRHVDGSAGRRIRDEADRTIG